LEINIKQNHNSNFGQKSRQAIQKWVISHWREYFIMLSFLANKHNDDVDVIIDQTGISN